MTTARALGMAIDRAPSARDRADKIAAGVVFRAEDGTVLLLKRSSTEENYSGHWALPGGKADAGEDAEAAAVRECAEEIGRKPEGALSLIDKRTTPNGMVFHTFETPVVSKFRPKLNAEHVDYTWAHPNNLPEPTHPAVKDVLKRQSRPTAQNAALSFDRASVRVSDVDGRLHVTVTNISKTNVCPYRGAEIPEWEALGLAPERIYKLYRDADELAKAAPTFNNIPLLSQHVPVSADDHQPDLVVGSTGTDAEFVAPYLRNSLVIWAAGAIKGVESGRQKELSSAYRYRADMTPGTVNGERYDGVMRDIVGNHVALVEEGRAGADVVVGDSKPKEETPMSKVLLSRKAEVARGALLVHLKPKLAADAKIDLAGILKGVTHKNFAERKAGIVAGIKSAAAGKLAVDATLDDLNLLLDKLDDVVPEEAKDADPSSGMREGAESDDMSADAGDPDEFLKSKLSADDLASYQKMCAARDQKAKDAELDAAKTQKDVDGKEKMPAQDADKDGKEKDMVSKPAMDAALAAERKNSEKAIAEVKTSVIKQMHEAAEAREFVRPHVGALPIALDSAEAIHRAAAKVLGIPDAETVHASALRALITVATNAKPAKESAKIAQDAASAKGFASRYPEASRIGHA